MPSRPAGRSRYGPGRSAPIEWNPIGWTLIKLAAVVLVAWFGVSVVTGWIRDNRTDTWSGPDQSVQSGEKLADCSEVELVRDEAFPSWIRYKGAIYRLTTSTWPFIGPGITTGYHDSGYALGPMHLILIDNSPEGRKLDTILLWIESGIAGREMARVSRLLIATAFRLPRRSKATSPYLDNRRFC